MKPQEIVIDITGEGKATGLHFDSFPLSQFGKVSIKRATDIKFNEVTQTWYIVPLPDVALGFGEFKTYEEAREFEVRWMHECMKHNIPHTSFSANRLAANMLAEEASPWE